MYYLNIKLMQYLLVVLLLNSATLIFIHSTHFTLISLCIAVVPSLQPPWLRLTFISPKIGYTTAAESEGFHTFILWASAWWVLFTINKGDQTAVALGCSHSEQWEVKRTVYISLFSVLSRVTFLEAVQFGCTAKDSLLFWVLFESRHIILESIIADCVSEGLCFYAPILKSWSILPINLCSFLLFFRVYLLEVWILTHFLVLS